MPPREHIVRVIKEWVGKAEGDYEAATQLFAMKNTATYDAVCFHAQQCVEKYLKAILVDHSLPVPKTHDIGKLFGLLPDPLTVRLTPEQMRWLTTFATDSRYPGGDAASEADAEETLATATSIRAAVRAVLPSEATQEE